MLKSVLLIALGGAIGSVLRYLIGVCLGLFYQGTYPWAIFLINVAGCLLLGIICGMGINKNIISPEIQLFLITGICGGFTSYSTFSFDILHLINHGQFIYALLFTLGSIIFGVLAIIGGVYLTK